MMEISDAVKQYLEKLIGEQTQSLSSRIAALEVKLNEKDKIIDELNGSLAVVRNGNKKYIDNMKIDMDDNAQYSRQYSIRIENIPYKKDETDAELKAKVTNVLKKAGVDVKDGTLTACTVPEAPQEESTSRPSSTTAF